MARATVVRADDYVRMPWKNGGGSTREIARDSGTGLEAFGWRLSMADITESGVFSTFAGYLRVISVVEGDGMTLRVDGEESRSLLPFEPFTFSGASEVSCTLLGGPICDLNLIFDPERYDARVRWLDSEERVSTAAETVLVFRATDYDCLRWDGDGELIEISVNAGCCLIELTSR